VNAVARARAERTIEILLECFSIVDFDLEIARLHARLGADLAAMMRSCAPTGVPFAATALSLDYRIATRDRRSFAKIPGLDTVYW